MPLLMADAALYDIFCPKFSGGIILQPFIKVFFVKPFKDRLVIFAIDRHDVFNFKLIDQQRRLRCDKNLCPHCRRMNEFAKDTYGFRMQAELGLVNNQR